MKLKPILLTVFALSPVTLAMAQEPPPPPDYGPMEPRPRGGMRRGGPDRPLPPPPPGPRGPAWKEMSEEDRKAVTNFMQEHFPRMVVELDRLKESAPKRYERRMDRVAPEMHRLMDAMQNDPHRAMLMIRERQIGLQLQQLADSYRAAKDDEAKAAIRKSVRELASQEFDNRLERRNMEVRQLETKLAELKGRRVRTSSLPQSDWVEALGGRVQIDSSPGQGTRVVVTVRIPPEGARA